MSCEAVAKVLFLDDDTIRTWHRLYEEDGIEGLASLGYEAHAAQRGTARQAESPGHRDAAADDSGSWCLDRARM
jgi:hypothetical protein